MVKAENGIQFNLSKVAGGALQEKFDQPESQFVFRMHEGGMAGLFESDGGMWRNTAIAHISDYLTDKLTKEISSGYIRIIA